MDTNEYKYAYDSIGNRQWAQMNAQSNSYVANDLNQYTNIIEGGTPETLFYDADGNLTNANGWTFSWNGENRLIRASDGTTTVSYVYDYMGRRIRKDVVSDTRNDSSIFIYDGWNLIAELGGMAFSPARADYYVWGLDLSGSLQGAGGIGGLLAHIPSGDTNTTASAHLAFCDANGNITDYIAIYPDGSGETNGTVVARYQYDPYGNLIEQNGPEADTLRFRFSSKYLESELETTTTDGLYYYGYRFYNPTLGRWLSRDPIAEWGGENLYLFVNDDPINGWDIIGMAEWRQIQELLRAVLDAQDDCDDCCPKINTYLHCIENHIVGDNKHLTKALDRLAYRLKKEKKATKYLKMSTDSLEFLRNVFDGQIYNPKETRSISKILRSAKKIIGPVNKAAHLGASASRGDALDLLLVVGAEFGPKGLDSLFGYYSEAYRTAVKMINDLVYKGSTAGKITHAADWCGTSCSTARIALRSGLPAGDPWGCYKELR